MDAETVALQRAPAGARWVSPLVVLGLALGIAGAGLADQVFYIGLAGVALLVLALVRLELAVATLVAAAPLLTFKFQGPVPIDSISIGVALVLAAAGIEVLREGRLRSGGLAHTPVFALFLAVAGVTLYQSIDPIEGLTVWVRYCGYFLLVYAVARSIRTREHAVALFALMLIAGSVSVLVGLFQIMVRPEESIGMAGIGEAITARMAGTFENPNFFAEYLVLIIPVGIALTIARGSLPRRVSFALLALVAAVGLALTFTRGSWLALALGVGILALLTKRWLLWIFAALAGAAILSSPSIAARVGELLNFSSGTGAFRLKLWRIPLTMIADQPLLGVGIGNYLATFTEYVFRNPELNVGWVVYGAHNSYLTLWAETGTIGLLAFLLVLGVAFRGGLALHRAARAGNDRWLQYANAGILAALVGFAFNGLTSNSFMHPRAAAYFWVLVGIQIGLSRMVLAPEMGPSRAVSGSYLVALGKRLAERTMAAFRNSAVVGPFIRSESQASSRLVRVASASPSRPPVAEGSLSLRAVFGLWSIGGRFTSGSRLGDSLEMLVQRPALAVVLLAAPAAVAYATLSVLVR